MGDKLLFNFEAKVHSWFVILRVKLQNWHDNGLKMVSRFKNVSEEEVNAFKTHRFKYCAWKNGCHTTHST